MVQHGLLAGYISFTHTFSINIAQAEDYYSLNEEVAAAAAAATAAGAGEGGIDLGLNARIGRKVSQLDEAKTTLQQFLLRVSALSSLRRGKNK